MTETRTTKTMADKGDEYVGRWPDAIATRVGLSIEYVAVAMEAVGLIDASQTANLRRRLLHESVKPLRNPAASAEALPEIGALTGPQAKAIGAELAAIKDGIAARRLTRCHFCGLPLAADGTCKECV